MQRPGSEGAALRPFQAGKHQRPDRNLRRRRYPGEQRRRHPARHHRRKRPRDVEQGLGPQGLRLHRSHTRLSCAHEQAPQRRDRLRHRRRRRARRPQLRRRLHGQRRAQHDGAMPRRRERAAWRARGGGEPGTDHDRPLHGGHAVARGEALRRQEPLARNSHQRSSDEARRHGGGGGERRRLPRLGPRLLHQRRGAAHRRRIHGRPAKEELRRMALRFIFVFFLLIDTALAQAPARMISGFPPGGAVDILARVFAEEWSKSIGLPVIVENITGAGGLLAMQNLKNAAPDGHTLAVSTDSSLIVYPHTVAKPLYNTFSDFTPIALTGSTVYALAIGTHVPAKDFSEFVAWAKANPEKSSFGASGAGSALQFYGILIAQTVGMPMTHIPYKGVGPSVADMIGGQIAASVVPIGPVLPQVRSGKARVLAHSGTTRLASVPEVPTFKELGYPTLESPVWFGIVGPA